MERSDSTTEQSHYEKVLTPEGYVDRHKKAFRCAFDYLNAHFPPESEPEWWERAAKDVSEASISNGENKLVTGLLLGVYDYLEDEWKLRRKENGEAEH